MTSDTGRPLIALTMINDVSTLLMVVSNTIKYFHFIIICKTTTYDIFIRHEVDNNCMSMILPICSIRSQKYVQNQLILIGFFLWLLMIQVQPIQWKLLLVLSTLKHTNKCLHHRLLMCRRKHILNQENYNKFPRTCVLELTLNPRGTFSWLQNFIKENLTF